MENINTIDYTTELAQIVDSLIAASNATPAAPKAAKPATSIATKAVDVAKTMVAQAADSSDKPAVNKVKPASSVAAKAEDVAKAMTYPTADSSNKPVVSKKPATTERKEVRSVVTTSKKSSVKKTIAPKKIVSSAQEKTLEVGQRVRHFAREKKGALRSGLDSLEGRLSDFLQELDDKLSGK